MHHKIDSKKIKALFGFRSQYCYFLISLLRGLCACETVCLSRLSLYIGYRNQKSAYQRIRRFLENVEFCQKKLAKSFIAFTGLEHQEKWVVTLDRTYWMFGQTHLTFLYMTVCAGNVCIPLFFNLLGPNKKGNSSFEERKTILGLFINCFGVLRIKYLLGDREFIGYEWLNHLIVQNISFSQRIREAGQTIANAQGKMVKASLLFAHVKPGEELDLGIRKIGSPKNSELCLPVRGTRSAKGELVIVVYNGIDDPLEAYRERWCIEICFRTLKSNGFHIEDSHVTNPRRIICLLNIVSLAYALTINIGLIIEKLKPRQIKKHGYYEKCLIRYTLDLIKPLLISSINVSKSLNKIVLNYNLIKLVG